MSGEVSGGVNGGQPDVGGGGAQKRAPMGPGPGPGAGREVEERRAPSSPPPMTPTSVSSQKSQKAMKRSSMKKSIDMMDLFSEHLSSVGNWADATVEGSFPATTTAAGTPAAPASSDVPPSSTAPSLPQKDVRVTESNDVRSTMVVDGSIEYADGSVEPLMGVSSRGGGGGSVGAFDAGASHSRQPLFPPDSQYFHLLVQNIRYDSSEEELFYFLGGADIVKIVFGPNNRGCARVTVSSQDAYSRIMALNGEKMLGRDLRISRVSYPSRLENDFMNGQHHQHRGSFRGKQGGRRVHQEPLAPPMPLPAYGAPPPGATTNMATGGYYTQPPPPRPPRNPLMYNNNSFDGYATLPSQRDFSEYRRNVENRSFRGAPQERFKSSRYNQQQQQYRGEYSTLPRPRDSQSNHYTGGYQSPPDTIARVGGVNSDGYGHFPHPQGGVVQNRSPAEHHERPKLELLPPSGIRKGGADPPRPKGIFGDTVPVDTYKKEQEAEERLRQQDEEFRKKNSAEHRHRKMSTEVDASHSYGQPSGPLMTMGFEGVKLARTSSSSRDGTRRSSGGSVVEGKRSSVSEESHAIPPPISETVGGGDEAEGDRTTTTVAASAAVVDEELSGIGRCQLPPSSDVVHTTVVSQLPQQPPQHHYPPPPPHQFQVPPPAAQQQKIDTFVPPNNLPSVPSATDSTQSAGLPMVPPTVTNAQSDNIRRSSTEAYPGRGGATAGRSKHFRTFTRSNTGKKSMPGQEQQQATGAASSEGTGGGSIHGNRGGYGRGGRRFRHSGSATGPRDRGRPTDRGSVDAEVVDSKESVKAEPTVPPTPPTATAVPTAKQEEKLKTETKTKDGKSSRASKKEKKKAPASKPMPKVEVKAVNFSSVNKFASLDETNA